MTRTAGEHWVTIIEPHSGWRSVDWRELLGYRDLFLFLVWRGIKARYAQSALGIGWAVIQPVFSMVVFTIIFGYLAGLSSNGAPYAVFTFVALVPWTYFANTITEGTASLVQNANMVKKVYFPRLVLPLSVALAKLVDFGIAMLILFGLLAWHRIMPTVYVVMVPALVVLMMLTAAGIATWFTALAIQYRDVNYAMTFVVQLLMYAAPVVYEVKLIPREFRILYALNPMVGVIEGFRAAFIGGVDGAVTTGMPWDLVATGAISSAAIGLAGGLYFRQKERIFADVA